MGRPGVVLALTALLAACSPATRPPGVPESALAVTTELDTPALQPREGDLSTAILRLRNDSSSSLILRDMTLLADPESQEMASAIASWQKDQPGHLELVADRNEWIYDRARAGKRVPLFNTGLLAPGESITVRTRLRLLHFPRHFHVLYFELSPEDLRQKVYFEVRRDKDVRYKLLFGQDLQDRLRPSTRPDMGSHRTVIFPHAEVVRPNAKIRTFSLDTPLRPRAFTLAEAAKRAGMQPPYEHTYTTALEGWVLRKGDAVRLVNADAVTPLPRLRRLERFFYFVDETGVGKLQVEFLRETKSVFAESWKLVPDKERGRVFLFIQPLDLPRFLKDVLEANLDLDVDMTAEGGRILVTRE